MHEAVQLLYIRNGLNCVIEQFSIFFLNVAYVRPRSNYLEIIKMAENWNKITAVVIV